MATRPKDLPEHEVLATYNRVVAALRAEGYDRLHNLGGEQCPLEPAEPGTLAETYLSILERVRSARARICRARRRAEHEANGTKIHQVFNDHQRDAARSALEAAEPLLTRAAQQLGEHAANIISEFYPLKIAEPPELQEARVIAKMSNVVRGVLWALRSRESSHDVFTSREWDDMLSDFAVELEQRGCGHAQIAAVLFGRNDEHAVKAIGQRLRRRRVASSPTPGAPAP